MKWFNVYDAYWFPLGQIQADNISRAIAIVRSYGHNAQVAVEFSDYEYAQREEMECYS